jgi:hypothetical protein
MLEELNPLHVCHQDVAFEEINDVIPVNKHVSQHFAGRQRPAARCAQAGAQTFRQANPQLCITELVHCCQHKKQKKANKHQPSATAQGNPGGMQLQTIQTCSPPVTFRAIAHRSASSTQKVVANHKNGTSEPRVPQKLYIPKTRIKKGSHQIPLRCSQANTLDLQKKRILPVSDGKWRGH